MLKVNLSLKQIEQLRKLWFVYGNSGKKETLFNHKYIQGFLEAQEDRKIPYVEGREVLKQKGMLSKAITDECIIEIEAVVYGYTIEQFATQYIEFICAIGAASSRKDPANALFDMIDIIKGKGTMLTNVAYQIKKNSVH